jgi:hypothetical protein
MTLGRHELRSLFLLLVVLLMAVSAPAATLDRNYQFGDDAGENGVPGDPVGVFIDAFILTFDSVGTLGASDLQDLEVEGNPTYVDTASRPLARGGEVGIRFDGNDYLAGENLNGPVNSRASIDYVDDDGNPAPGPHNYRTVVNRGFQMWVKAGSAGLGNGQPQSLVVDSNQHGALISGDGTWLLRYAGADVDSGVGVDANWHHVMVARPFGPTGASGGARMWVDGVALAAAAGGYDAAVRERLVVGANTSLDETGNFTGGTQEYFRGDMDNLSMFIMGDSSSDLGPPPGQDYGEFDFGVTNEFAASVLSGIAGDIDQDGDLDEADKSDFVTGWLNENLVGGIPVGDINTIRSGDLNFDGVTDLRDLTLFQSALRDARMAPISASDLAGVPEPAGMMMTLLGLLSLVATRRQLFPTAV